MTRISALVGLCLAAPTLGLAQTTSENPPGPEAPEEAPAPLVSDDETMVIDAADAVQESATEAVEAADDALEQAVDAAAESVASLEEAEPVLDEEALDAASVELSEAARGSDAGSIGEALRGGRAWLDTRYRFEGAEVRGFLERSWASTARLAGGYETGSYRGFRLFVEGEGVTSVLSDDYNDGTGSRPNQAPVFDPETLEFNQAYLGYRAGDLPLDLLLGRQEVSFDDGRFVGADPWRQNNQSFDALRARYRASDALELDYTYAFKVHRVFSNSSPLGNEDLKSHWLNATYETERYGRLGAFAYLNDFSDLQTLSTNTFGARWAADASLGELGGEDVVGDLQLVYARQSDAYDNPVDVDADYWLARVGAERAGLGVAIAVETLGGSGDAGDSFSTPFASVQDFNGFADQFRATPDGGLVDSRVEVGYDFTLTGWELPSAVRVTYHRFESDAGDLDYGRELDVDFVVDLTDRLAVGARYADFNGDEVFRNANRASAWLSYSILR